MVTEVRTVTATVGMRQTKKTTHKSYVFVELQQFYLSEIILTLVELVKHCHHQAEVGITAEAAKIKYQDIYPPPALTLVVQGMNDLK